MSTILTLTIPTDEKLHEALQERAAKQGKTVPELAREILSEAVAELIRGPVSLAISRSPLKRSARFPDFPGCPRGWRSRSGEVSPQRRAGSYPEPPAPAAPKASPCGKAWRREPLSDSGDRRRQWNREAQEIRSWRNCTFSCRFGSRVGGLTTPPSPAKSRASETPGSGSVHGPSLGRPEESGSCCH